MAASNKMSSDMAKDSKEQFHEAGIDKKMFVSCILCVCVLIVISFVHVQFKDEIHTVVLL